ncbi:cell division protein PerM [Streptomyces radiopugnans]|uniref:cell division protein PerM n=1 Tax=Streptomyces radiopugnans TaxID=403935 RepID=UPI003F1AECDF
MAAGLGLGGIAVLVILLWITSPHPDDGPGGALRIAADLWLVAHGAPLVRTETLSGSPAPVGLVPLLLCAVPVWLLHRTASGAVRGPASARVPGGVQGAGSGGSSGAGDAGAAWRATGWIIAGYLLVAALVTVYAASGPIRVDPLGAALRLPAVVAAAAAAGTWTGLGRPLPEAPLPLPRRMRRRTERPALTRAGASAALRGAAAATAALCAGGALLAAGALLWHVATAQRAAFPSPEPPAPTTSGLAAVLLLALALTPNAAVWGASYGLGPGFTLGGDSVVRPSAVAGLPPLPDFPLLAAVPAEGPGTAAAWAAAFPVPLAGGLLAAWCVARAAVPARGGLAALDGRATACAAVLAACGCGAAMAVLAACAGGPLGTGALAHLGPDWRLTGAAALGWTAVLGAPAALALRSWRLRPARGR